LEQGPVGRAWPHQLNLFLEKSKLQRGVQLSAAKFPKTIVLSHAGCGRIHEAAAANTDEPLEKLH